MRSLWSPSVECGGEGGLVSLGRLIVWQTLYSAAVGVGGFGENGATDFADVVGA